MPSAPTILHMIIECDPYRTKYHEEARRANPLDQFQEQKAAHSFKGSVCILEASLITHPHLTCSVPRGDETFFMCGGMPA